MRTARAAHSRIAHGTVLSYIDLVEMTTISPLTMVARTPCSLSQIEVPAICTTLGVPFNSIPKKLQLKPLCSTNSALMS